jgi:hypothetical protein
MSQRAALNRTKAINQPVTTKFVVKRKFGYNLADDEVQDARNKMVNMTMNDRE